MPLHPSMSYDEYDAEQEGDSGYALPDPPPAAYAPAAYAPAARAPPAARAEPAGSDDDEPYDSRSPSPDEAAPPTLTAADRQIADLWNTCSSYPFEYMDEERRNQLKAYAAAIRTVRHGDIGAIARPAIGRDDILIEFAMLYASTL